MKTIRITVEKEGAQAVCINRYHWDDHPETSEWTGNRKAFMLTCGEPVDFAFSLYDLPEDCAFQCAQCGATFQIEDLGGETEMWMDNVIF